MNKITAKVEGMMCGMCEAHMCDALREAFPDAQSVKADRKNCELTFVINGELDAAKLEKTVKDTGYTFVSASSEPYVKRGLFGN